MSKYYIYEFDDQGLLDSVRLATQEEIDTIDWKDGVTHRIKK